MCRCTLARMWRAMKWRWSQTSPLSLSGSRPSASRFKDLKLTHLTCESGSTESQLKPVCSICFEKISSEYIKGENINIYMWDLKKLWFMNHWFHINDMLVHSGYPELNYPVPVWLHHAGNRIKQIRSCKYWPVESNPTLIHILRRIYSPGLTSHQSLYPNYYISLYIFKYTNPVTN